MLKFKKALSILLAAIMLLSCVPVFATETEEIPSGTCGENAIWSINVDTETLTINGTGITNDYSSGNKVPWYSYINNITNIVIGEGITYIGNHICDFVDNISISSTVIEIPEEAFQNPHNFTVAENNPNFSSEDNILYNKDKTELICFKREGIDDEYTIIDGVTTIKPFAFSYANIGTLHFSDTVTTIEDYAFFYSYCAEINLSKSVKDIDSWAFAANHGKLKNVNVSEENPYFASIDGVLFSKDLKTLIYYPAIRTRSYTVPNTVTTIADMAFNCSNLTKICIPESVTSIGHYAFIDLFTSNIYIENKTIGLNLEDSPIVPQTAIHAYCFSGEVPEGTLPAYYYAREKKNKFFSLGHEYSEWKITKPATATEQGTKTRTCSVCRNADTKEFYLVDYPVTDITTSTEEIFVNTNKTFAISATVAPLNATNKNLIYTSLNEAIATVNENGIVTGVATGITTINVRPADGSDVEKNIKVKVRQSVTNITVKNSDIILNINETSTINATATPSDAVNKVLAYESLDKNIATVDANGVITGITPGTTTISVSSVDAPDVIKTITVTVVNLNEPEEPTTEETTTQPEETTTEAEEFTTEEITTQPEETTTQPEEITTEIEETTTLPEESTTEDPSSEEPIPEEPTTKPSTPSNKDHCSMCDSYEASKGTSTEVIMMIIHLIVHFFSTLFV